MKIAVPLSIRKLKHNAAVNYRDYLDELIGMKLEIWRKKALDEAKYNKLAVGRL